MLGGGGLCEAGEDQVNHATSVVVGDGLDSDAQVADAQHQVEGSDVVARVARGGGGFQQLVEHGQQAFDELGVQALESGLV